MPKVLITNGLQRKALAAARSLGKKGIDTIIVEETIFSPATFSKYCTKALVCPNAGKQPESFYKSIVDIIKKYNCDVFFPMDDDTMALSMEHKDELSKLCLLPIPPINSYRITSDKGNAYKHALSVGVNHPKTVFPKDIANLYQLTTDLKFPLVIKPVKSNGGRGIKIVHEKEKLEQTYLEVHKSYPYPIIQEYLGEGDVYDVVLLYNSKSELRASFIQKQVRKYPFVTGPSSVQQSIIFPEMLQMALTYMKGLEWYGIADLEFMVQKETGNIFFVELNAKFWSSLQMGILAGVDFPWLLYRIATEGDVEAVTNYNVGVRCRNLLPSDLLHFIFNKNRKNMNPPFWCGKEYNIHDDIIWREDPLPTIGFFLACCRYLFDKNMWKLLLRL